MISRTGSPARRLAALGAVTLWAAAPAQAPAAPVAGVAQLLDRADGVYRGQTAAAVVVMEVTTRAYQRRYSLAVWDERRSAERTLVKILGPSLWRGHAMLKVGAQLKLYDPRSDHVTVVGQTMLEDRWMGSHYTHDDLVRETHLARDYTAAPLETWTRKDAGGGTCHRLELRPRPTAPVAWGRILYELCAIGGDVIPVRATYYKDASSQRSARTLAFTEPRRFGARLVPTVVTLTPTEEPDESSTLRYESLQLDLPIPDGKFSEQALR